MLNNYTDFCRELLGAGFSMGGGNPKGIFSVVPFSWENQDGIDSPVRWHTGDAETDPWEWRMRVLEERNDIAYSKLFFRASGYITAEWYPEFYAVRRRGEVFDEAYSYGTLSTVSKRIYEIISENGVVAYHEIKRLGGFSREDNLRFERAIVELQTRMYITMCGRMQKTNRLGKNYGWNSIVFTTVENFWSGRGVALPDLDPDKSFEKIRERVLALNPSAEERTIRKFIKG